MPFPAYTASVSRLAAMAAFCASVNVDGSIRKRSGSWYDSSATSGRVSEKKSAIGCPGTVMPTPFMITTPATRGLFSRAISAAIQPPSELPTTVTSVRSCSSSRSAYSWASACASAMSSGRGVPLNPGCVGTRTRAGRRSARWAPKDATDTEPAPPCRRRKGRPEPKSSK